MSHNLGAAVLHAQAKHHKQPGDPCVMRSLLRSVTAPYDCLRGLVAMLWYLCVLAVCTQMERLKDSIRSKADHATERITAHGLRLIDVMDAIICAEPPKCNDVCHIVEQAWHAGQEHWLPVCVLCTMLHSIHFLCSVLLNEPEAFTSSVVLMLLICAVAMLQSRLMAAAGAWQKYAAAITHPRTRQPTST